MANGDSPMYPTGSGQGWQGLVDQYGRGMPPITTQPGYPDPGFQPPSDPLKDRGQLVQRAKIISREIPNTSIQSGFTPTSIRVALEQLILGNFDFPAQLHEVLVADSRVFSANSQRTGALLGKPISWRPPKHLEKDSKAKACCAEVEKHWDEIDAEPAVLNMLITAWALGFSYTQIIWDFTTSENKALPYLQSFNARYSWYHWIWRKHMIVTQDSSIPCGIGDGHWILHAPYGQYRGWIFGAIRTLAQWALARDYCLRDWGAYCEKHGFPLIMAETPFGADPTSIANFQYMLLRLGQNTVAQLPGSVDVTKYGKYGMSYLEPKDQGWKAFQGLITQCNMEIVLAILGSNLTMEISDKGARSAADTHAETIQTTHTASDARAMQRTLYTQFSRPFAAINYGQADYAPKPVWNVKPPEDQLMKAQTFASFADGYQKMRQAGGKIRNIESFARKFGLRGLDLEEVDPTQVEARVAGATGEVDESPDDAPDDKSPSDSKPAKGGVTVKPVKPVKPVKTPK